MKNPGSTLIESGQLNSVTCTESSLRNGILQQVAQTKRAIPMANNLPREKQLLCLKMLCEGNSIRAVERTAGVHRDTIMRLMVRFGEGCQAFLDDNVRHVDAKHLEIDEQWTWVAKKQKRCSVEEHAMGDFLHHSPFAEVRASAAWVLATSHERSVTDDLVEPARDEQEDADVRRGALAALRQHARPTEVDWLADAVRNPQLDSSWRANALEAILAVAFRCRDSSSAARVEYIAAKLVHEVLETEFEDLKLAAAQFSDRLGDEIAPLLVQVCERGTEPVSVREAACQSLGKLKYAPAADVLLQLQREPQITRIAEAAASALTQINPLRLLGEATASAEKALAEFCLRTGCLIFDDRIINARGRRLIWSGHALEAEQVSDIPSNLVFLSYCRKDQVWLDKLRTMLSPLVRNHTLSVWYDGDIQPSQEWLQEIHTAMESAKVAVLLVSDNFLASDFITQVELPFFVEAAKRKQVTLLWVLVKNCLYKQTPLFELQAAHDPSPRAWSCWKNIATSPTSTNDSQPNGSHVVWAASPWPSNWSQPGWRSIQR